MNSPPSSSASTEDLAHSSSSLEANLPDSSNHRVIISHSLPIHMQDHRGELPSSPPLPGLNAPINNVIRKCPGKNRQANCLQLSMHPNTRWECAFSSPSREEFLKHCKNISKRNKWKELGEFWSFFQPFLRFDSFFRFALGERFDLFRCIWLILGVS